MLKLPTRCKWCPSSFSSSMILKSATPGSRWPALFSPTSCKDTLTQGMFSGNIQVCSFFSVCKWASPVLLSFSHLIFDRSPKSLSTPKSPVINDFNTFKIEFTPSLYLCEDPHRLGDNPYSDGTNSPNAMTGTAQSVLNIYSRWSLSLKYCSMALDDYVPNLIGLAYIPIIIFFVFEFVSVKHAIVRISSSVLILVYFPQNVNNTSVYIPSPAASAHSLWTEEGPHSVPQPLSSK